MCPGFAYGFQARTPKVDSARKFNRREDSRRHRKMHPAEEAHHGKLLIKLMKNGTAILEGYYTLESAEGSQQPSNKGVALCRCGGSSQKPFCDGTHRKIDFKD